MAIVYLRRDAELRLHFPFPVLLCDIGGTNVRACAARALGEAPSAALHTQTHDHRGLAEALRSFDANWPQPPRSLIVCAAGPLEGRRLKLTNAEWTIDGPLIADALKLDQGLLLNDFEAQALSLPALRPEWIHEIGAVPMPRGGLRLVLGPGTGLGAAALAEIDGRHLPLATEIGHTDLGPANAEEEAVWPYLERVEGRVTAESVISGPGLVRLHMARAAARRVSAEPVDGVAIVDRALSGSAEDIESVRLFWRIVARFSGDLALAFLATGGLSLSGGILPRICDLLDPAEFRRIFEAKAPLDHVARAIPTRVIMRGEGVLAGMAALAANPESYIMDYRARAWRPPR
ncbi:MAG: glucokinase [Methylobacteriaceae bacterium]|nr:glucokinase [Methylobacteriaceae bacterium]